MDIALLPQDELEAAEVLLELFAAEGIRFVQGIATEVRNIHGEIQIAVGDQRIAGDMLLVATGRSPNVDGLGLEVAGVAFTKQGIEVDRYLRTAVKHIYAAGDCTGGYQLTHYAGWQGFQAARNALLPGNSEGVATSALWTTFTDPEVAHVGLSEADARSRHGEDIQIAKWDNDRVDRAVCDHATSGFVKIVHLRDGTILGATVVSPRAGEVISEISLALRHDLKMRDLAEAMHVYPAYSMPVMQMSADVAMEQFLGSRMGKLAKRLAGIG